MAKKNKTSVQMSEQYDGKEFKGYRKYVYGKMFTLGKDKEIAILKATALVAAGRMLKTLKKNWTEDVIRQAYCLALGIPLEAMVGEQADARPQAASPPSVGSRASTTNPAAITLHQAVARYIKSLETNRAQKEFGAEQHLSLINRMACLKHAFAHKTTLDFFNLPDDKQKLVEIKPIYMERPPLKDKPIAEITEDDLNVFKIFMIARPTSRRTKMPLGVQTIKNNLQSAKRFFKFAKKEKLWNAFEDWQDLFRFRRNQKRNMMTPAEKTAVTARKDHMTDDDLKLYWSLSVERTRLFQSLAYWCAWTQVEISTFRKVEFYREKGEAFIDKSRSKTGEAGKWWVPEPVAVMVEKYMAKTSDDPAVNPDGLAFLTKFSKPLVHHGDGFKKRSDVIADSLWKPIQYLSKKNGRSHSFKWFRKTFSDQIGQMTGNRFVAKAALAQRINDVANTNYINPLTERFIAAAKELWETKMKTIHVFDDDPEQVKRAKKAIAEYAKVKNKSRQKPEQARAVA
jgi:hypothetical protein